MKLIKKILTLGGILAPKNDKAKKNLRGEKAKSKTAQGNARRPSKPESAPEKRRGGPNGGKRAKTGESAREKSFGGKKRQQRGQDSDSRKYKSERPRAENLKEIVRISKDVPQIPSPETLADDVPLFAALGLGERTLAAIRELGYMEPTDIQIKAIPVALAGKDIVGTAQTGTGKTAAFSLPIIERIKPSANKIKLLVLSPTRELASQICTAFDSFAKYTDLKSVLVQGGVSMDRQVKAIQSGVDVVVATPGRLLDLVRSRLIDLSGIEFLILDEVDRMFDMGFIEDVSNIIRYCPKQRQTLFFSATMPPAVMSLSKWALTEPERIEIGIIHSPAETIEHFVYPVDAIQKYDMILSILSSIKDENVIVFTRTRMDADRIGEWLAAHDYKVATLHSDRTQRERDKALADFKEGRANVLVATDIASRGLDISNVTYVINFNVPEHSEDYVHRIGRTGRAKTEGRAITLFAPDELAFLQRIERFIDRPIERRKLDGFQYRNEPDLGRVQKVKKRRNR